MSVLIIAERFTHEFYRALCLRDEEVTILSPAEYGNHLTNEEIELVVVDTSFNPKRGVSLIEEIKALYSNTPVVFLTNISSESLAIQAWQLGVREYIKKPVSVFRLRRVVENLLGLKRNSRERRSPLRVGQDEKDEGVTGFITTDVPPNILRSVIDIEENLSERYSLGHFAEKANLSKYHFCRMFKKHTGMTPMEFVKVLRIHKAKKLLKKKDLSISYVAAEVGFYDLSNFERQFKQITGVTPSSYKESQQNT